MQNQLPNELVRFIENLNEDQLHTLCRIVTQRLNLLHRARALYAMKNFHMLDRVSFTHNGKYMEGTITRLNQKTVTVILDDGNHWNVSPGLLTKLKDKNSLKEFLTEKK